MPDPIVAPPAPEGIAPQATSIRKSLAYVYVGYAFRYLYLLILIPFYGRVLGAHEYGRVLAAMSLFQIVWLLAEYGYVITGARDAAQATTPSSLARVYGQHVHGRLLTCGLGLVVGIVGTWLSPVLREQPLFGLLATFNGLLAAFNLGWMLQGMQRFRTSVALEVLGFCISLSCILVLVRGQHDGVWVMASLTLSSAVCTAVAHGIAWKALEHNKVHIAGGWQLLRDSTAMFTHRSLGMLTSTASTYMLSLFASPAQVGWYGAAERLASVALSLMQPAGQVLTSTVTRHLGLPGGDAKAFRLMRKALYLMTGLGFLMLAGTWVLGGWAVPLVLGPDFGPSIHMLHIMAWMFPFSAFVQVATGYVLIPLRHDMAVTRATFINAVFTLALIALLGKAYGGEGVAIARTAGTAFIAMLMVYTLRQKSLLHKVLYR